MKIIHFSDLHIGVENFSKFTGEEYIADLPDYFAPGIDLKKTYLGLPTRLVDTLRAFDYLINDAINLDVDLVVFAGDAFRSRDPSQTHQREFAIRIRRLADHGIAVFLLAGNHDIPNAQGRATSLDIYSTLQVPNVTVATNIGIQLIETKSGVIQIAGLPWLRRSAVVSEYASAGKSIDETRQATEEFLSVAVDKMADEIDPNIPSILVSHATVATAKLGSETSMMMGNDYVLLPGVIGDKRFDYIALGHIHKHQIISTNPLTVYSGSLHRVDFSEENDEKGYCLVTINSDQGSENRSTEFIFNTVWSRTFRTVNIDIVDSDLDPTGTIVDCIIKEKLDDSIVRINILADRTQLDKIETQIIVDSLKKVNFMAALSIKENINELNKTRINEVDMPKDITPIDALDLYLADRKIDTERRGILNKYAEKLIDSINSDI